MGFQSNGVTGILSLEIEYGKPRSRIEQRRSDRAVGRHAPLIGQDIVFLIDIFQVTILHIQFPVCTDFLHPGL